MYEEKERHAERTIHGWQANMEDAHMHAVKEFGPYYDVALAHLGTVMALQEAVYKALSVYSPEQQRTENGSGKIITGLLKLQEYGLNAEQVAEMDKIHASENKILALQHEIKIEGQGLQEFRRMQDARLHASKELGRFYQAAVTALGSSQAVVEKARIQLDVVEGQKLETRNGHAIIIGLLDLENLGLSAEQAAERKQEIESEQEAKKASHASKISKSASYVDHAEESKGSGFNTAKA